MCNCCVIGTEMKSIRYLGKKSIHKSLKYAGFLRKQKYDFLMKYNKQINSTKQEHLNHKKAKRKKG